MVRTTSLYCLAPLLFFFASVLFSTVAAVEHSLSSGEAQRKVIYTETYQSNFGTVAVPRPGDVVVLNRQLYDEHFGSSLDDALNPYLKTRSEGELHPTSNAFKLYCTNYSFRLSTSTSQSDNQSPNPGC
jgi:hypothetical protein